MIIQGTGYTSKLTEFVKVEKIYVYSSKDVRKYVSSIVVSTLLIGK